jgi:uncharacterized protein
MNKQTKSMLTRDGIRLDADIYYPQEKGEFPVLLMRQPYGREIASTVVYNHPSWYVQKGYIVVIQDVRGRGTSEGDFELFVHEVNDGFDAVNWAANLPQSNGKLGMYGFSYQGMTQLYAASTKPQFLKAICPAMIGYDLYQDWAYEGGAFCLQANLGWAIQLAAETARLKGDENTYQQLFNLSRNLPLYDQISANPDIFKQLAPDSFYHQWLEHDQSDEYWQNLSPNLQDVDLPMLHIGGWFDTYMRGTLRLYKEMSNRSKYLQKLIVGVWAHLPWGSKINGVNYGLNGQSNIDILQVKWFDYFLKDQDHGLLAESPVLLFQMGENKWRSLDNYPTENKQELYLSSTGLASVREDDGLLLEKTDKIPVSIDTFVHDPWRPVPAMGGHASYPVGSGDRSTLDCRTDILKYTTKPLEKDLEIMGDMTVEVYCQVNKPSFDLCAILSEVKPDGTVYNFSQGYVRIDEHKNEVIAVKINLQPTCIKISQGHSLRLSISGAYFPAYPVNSGTGKKAKTSHWIDHQIITISVLCGDDFPSKVIL